MAENGELERLQFWELGIWQRRRKGKDERKNSRLISSISQSFLNTGDKMEEGGRSLLTSGIGQSRCTKAKKRTTCDQITQKFLKGGFTS